MINKNPASKPKLFVAAIQPSIKGIAPGIAPMNTAKGVTGFKGVYILVYMKIEIAPNKADFGLMLYKIEIPRTVNKIAIENNINNEELLSIQGSGKSGRVTKLDILNY